MHAFTNSAAAPARPADSDNLRSTLSSADLLAYAAVTVANNSTLVKVNETSNDNGSRTGSPLAALLPNPFFSWKLQLATDCDSETLPSGNSLYNTHDDNARPQQYIWWQERALHFNHDIHHDVSAHRLEQHDVWSWHAGALGTCLRFCETEHEVCLRLELPECHQNTTPGMRQGSC